jgi:uncharacterized protein
LDLVSALDSADEREFVRQWERWHHAHEQRRARPHGFLAITGLHWLSDEPTRYDDVPGAWSSDGRDVAVLLEDDEELIADDQRVVGSHRFRDIDEVGIGAWFGEGYVEVARRDGHFMIRPRHPDNDVRTRYVATPTFPPKVHWAVQGVFHPHGETQSVRVDTSVEGLTQDYESVGDIEFVLDQQVLRLVAFQDDDPRELFIVFTDLTAGTTTYRACRFLTVDAPDDDGRVLVDFNRATNPPCAYTDFATCPLPPRANHLSVGIEAGEMVPSATLSPEGA